LVCPSCNGAVEDFAAILRETSEHFNEVYGCGLHLTSRDGIRVLSDHS
jgi:hypothetical protein